MDHVPFGTPADPASGSGQGGGLASSPTCAAGPVRRRPRWPDLPEQLRAAIEQRLGARVERSESRDGGYSPGLASVVWTAAGPVFLKAAGQAHPHTQLLYRQEAARVAALPASVPAPRFRWLAEVDVPGDVWVVLAFDAAQGHSPRVPWDTRELDAVAQLCGQISGHALADGSLPPAAGEMPHGHWERLADWRPAAWDTYDPWMVANIERLAAVEADLDEAVVGDRLVHGDLRGDNTVLRVDGTGLAAVAVDWPYAVRGAPFLDFVGMLPAIHLEGGPRPQTMLLRYPHLGGPDEAVTSFLAALTGYFVDMSLRPPPAGIPHVRAFQRAQAQVCIAWLRERIG